MSVRIFLAVLAVFALFAIFARTGGYDPDYSINASIQNNSIVETSEPNVTVVYNNSRYDCTSACNYKVSLTKIDGTVTYRNCGIQKERVFCFDKKGKIKCETNC